MFCTNCGSQVPDNAAFCTSCGQPIKVPQQEAPQQETPQSQEFVPPIAPAYEATEAADAKQTKKGINPVIIASIIVAVIAVVAIVAMLAMRGGSGGNVSSNSASNKAAGTSLPALDLHISQVDNSAFPVMTLYASITENGAQPTTAVGKELFTLSELSSDGAEYVGTIDTITPLAVGDAMNINLVLDQSGSMSSSSKMSSAKNAACTFVDEITSTEGNVAEITSFDDYVYNVQPFTNENTLLKSAVNSLSPTGETALYDALYWALQRTNLKTGSRVVIAFTDGEENASHYKESDVVELSSMTGIPVYIVGIGDSINRGSLQSLASQCNGAYFDASTTNLQTALSDIYKEIYTDQRSMYKIVYTSSYTGDESKYRTVRVKCADGAQFEGSTETKYMPVDNAPTYDTSVNAKDYVLPDSGSRYYSRAELEKLSLWELYLARNEVFARYGRGFKNQDLVEYFATKRWYHQTASPEDFDARPSPLNDYEMKNTSLMLEIEKARNSPYLTTRK